jgi:phage major head subunit gpT-like protein
MILAKASEHVIECACSPVEWIQAKEGETHADDSPKRFKMRAYTGGPMLVGYYGSPVVIDMAGLTAKAPLPILMNHDMGQIVGHADEIDAGESNLDLSGIVSGATQFSEQVVASSKNGFPWKASVGARPDKMEFVGEGITTKVNGKTFTGPLYVARQSTLGEVSFVAMAADSKTKVNVAASAANFTERKSKMDEQFLQWLEASGFDAATLTETQKTALEANWKKATSAVTPAEPAKPVEAKPDPVAEIRAEMKRVADIQAACVPNPAYTAEQSKAVADIQAKAIAENWLPIKAECEVIKATLPKGPAIHASTREVNGDAISAAFAMSCGLKKSEDHFKPEVLEAASRHRGMGIQELLLIQAMQNGYTGRMAITQGNVREVLRAAFSTHTITTLLSTTGNKVLLEGFNSIPQVWREVAAVRSVSDFKATTCYRLTTDLEYEEVGPGGEIKHGTMGQESYTRQIRTFAKMLAITRQDIINDDLGAFDAIKQRLGIGAAIKIDNTFWTVWLAARNGAAFWTAARGNLVAGAALAEAGLNSAVKAFRDMEGPDGNMMNLEPKLLLVPTALEATALKIYSSQEIRDTTASTKYPTANIYQNRFRPVTVPQMGSTSYTGYSATSWHLLADPNVLASAEMCFLDGQQSPTIESADADFDTLGIQFRGYHDFYPNMSEWRASVECQA